MKEGTACGLCLLLLAICLSACQGSVPGKKTVDDRENQSRTDSETAAAMENQKSISSPGITAEAESPDLQAIPASQADSENGKLKLDYGRAPIQAALVLDPIQDPPKPGSSHKGQPLQVGIGRELPPPYSTGLNLNSLKWTKLGNGGQAAAFSVTSSGAGSIRIALAQSRLTDGVELRFFGNTSDRIVYGPYSRSNLARAWSLESNPAERQFSYKSLFWSPVVDGQTIAIEIYLPPGSEPADSALIAPVLSHLYR